MNLLIFIVLCFILWRVWKKHRPTPCKYERHEMNHAQTLTQLTHREVQELRRELKDTHHPLYMNRPGGAGVVDIRNPRG